MMMIFLNSDNLPFLCMSSCLVVSRPSSERLPAVSSDFPSDDGVG